MKLIAQVKLQPTEGQSDSLRRTLLAWNEAANYIFSWKLMILVFTYSQTSSRLIGFMLFSVVDERPAGLGKSLSRYAHVFL